VRQLGNREINWPVELQAYVMDGQWDSLRLGARPLHAGCRAPADLVARYFPDGKPAYGPNGPHPEIHESIRYFEETTNAELDEAAKPRTPRRRCAAREAQRRRLCATEKACGY
jgi:hypothetical protein